jgi:predicted RNA-binding protein with PUA-like domain
MRYWLMKCEPAAYTIEDLKRDKVTSWEGVRNFQARNFMRDRMQVGDPVLFYASNAEPSGVTGLARIARAGYPDQYAFKPGHKYYDPDSDKGTPVWYMVDVEFVEQFPDTLPLETLKHTKGLEDMMVIKKGSRLSVQPVSKTEYEIVVRLGRKAKSVQKFDASSTPSGGILRRKRPAR